MKLKKILFHFILLLTIVFLKNETTIYAGPKKTLGDIFVAQGISSTTNKHFKKTNTNERPLLFKMMPNIALFAGKKLYDELFPNYDTTNSKKPNPIIANTEKNNSPSQNSPKNNYYPNHYLYNVAAAFTTEITGEHIILPYLKDNNYINKETQKDLKNTLQSNTAYHYYNLLYQTPHYDTDKNTQNKFTPHKAPYAKKIENLQNTIQNADIVHLRYTLWYTTHNFAIRIGSKKLLTETEIGKTIMNSSTIKEAAHFIDENLPGQKETIKEGALMAATVCLQLAEQYALNYLVSLLDNKKNKR